MLVTLVGKKNISKIILPKTIEGNYWLTDRSSNYERKLINIEGKNGKWNIISNNYARIINPKAINFNDDKIKIKATSDSIVINKIAIKEYGTYGICFGDSDEIFILYCSPVYEGTVSRLDIKNTTEIFIGKNEENHICYDNPLISNEHARMFLDSGRWTIENLDNKFGTFVNNTKINENRILFNGDIIFIMGLKIIIIGNSLFINNPLNKINYKSKNLVLYQKKVETNQEGKQRNNDEIELYSEKEYFSRAPRIINIMEHEKIKIDVPPEMQDKEEMPFLLVLGSSLSMAVMMMVSMYMTIDGRVNGTSTTKQTISSLIMSISMLIAMLLFPILSRRYEKKKKLRYEEKRQNRYKKYIDSKIKKIDDIMLKQRNILFNNYLSEEECAEIILNRGKRLWERKIEDQDFLTVRLGIGDVPSNIDIEQENERFRMEDDNLLEILETISHKSKILKVAPIVISLTEKNILALISSDDESIRKFMQNLIIQLIAFHSYDELKLVFLLKKDINKKWETMKMLPYIWSNIKDIRFFADDYTEMQEISKYLEEELKNRITNEKKDYKNYSPYYLIITDDYKKIENLKIITEILDNKQNLGFTLLCITDNLMHLPNECKTFISIDGENGKIFESEMATDTQKVFEFDTSRVFFFEKLFQKVANIPIKYTVQNKFVLPNAYTFLEMYDVGKIEQLNILERWNGNDSTLSLQAPIGIDATGRIINLDIHERFHGPHGLIAGSTGSGKSEFIITYILSLAINYSPEDVTFILIDYKGGGLAGAFQKKNMKLPHLVGTITNIDTVGLQRSLASIQSELRRRQIMFNEARNITDEGTIDIYKYQKLYHEGIVDKPIPHLLIICDEFAELKQQQEDFMDELMSVSRIGRSLGVHLILATQKPAGIVNEQIRSNSKFAICLKVQSPEDSNDVIRKPDAASLRNSGQFFIKVGNDEYFNLGQSGWSGAIYYPSNVTKKKIDTSIEFISNIGITIKAVDDSLQETLNNKGEQLTNILKYIYLLAKRESVRGEQLWLDSIPENIFIDEIKRKYNIGIRKGYIESFIGEYDDPTNQRQNIVKLDFTNGGNTIIYGNSNSGKETLLSTMIYDLITSYKTDDIWIYILDFGSEALKIFRDSPHVGDIAYLDDNEKISRFFEMIQSEIKNRKNILSDYNGDYNLYKNSTTDLMPTILIVINNYETFSENYEDTYEDIFTTITREGSKYGIIFVVTVSSYNDMRYRLAHNFKQKVALQLNNEDDFYNVLENVGKKRPSRIFGRGLIPIDDNIFEFQTAKISEPDLYNQKIKESIEKIKSKNKILAPSVPVLPDKVEFKDIQSELVDISKIPLGISKKDLKIVTYNFKKNFITMITSKNIEFVFEYMAGIIREIRELQDVKLFIFDAERVFENKKEKMREEFDTLKYKLNSGKDLSNQKHTIYIFLGIEKFLNDLEIKEDEFNEILRKMEETQKCSIIFADNATRFKNHEYDVWYKNFIIKDNGIWIGGGIDDQYLINISLDRKDIVNNCDCSFGYIITQSNPTMIKLLEMKGQDNNE